MSLVLPPLFHWSPTDRRAGIRRRGLQPRCPTWTPIGTRMEGGARDVDPDATSYAVCLGTTPSHAWSLCGALWGENGETWDLWQVNLEDSDTVHPLPFSGNRLEEIRVANVIPYRQLWLVGSRTITRAWSCR